MRSLHFPPRLSSTAGQTPKALSGVDFAFRPVFTGHQCKITYKEDRGSILLVVLASNSSGCFGLYDHSHQGICRPFLASPIASAQVRNTDDKVSRAHSSKKIAAKRDFSGLLCHSVGNVTTRQNLPAVTSADQQPTAQNVKTRTQRRSKLQQYIVVIGKRAGDSIQLLELSGFAIFAGKALSVAMKGWSRCILGQYVPILDTGCPF